MSEKKATREAYGAVLIELAKAGRDVVALDADLASSTTTAKFGAEFPDRFFNVGVAEQNMIGVAAGLAASGKIAYTGSFAVFATGRAFDQIRNTVCYGNLNVKICPTHAGLTVGPDGASHQALEDIALMRSLPNMRVIVPADYYEAAAALRAAADIDGPVFVRLGRAAVPVVYDESRTFELGEADVMAEGGDVTIAACGIMVEVALRARDLLAAGGISAEVINVSSVKPIDAETLVASAAKTGHVVTAEEHTIQGGLGGAIAEVLSEQLPTPMLRVGVRDMFGTSGPADELLIEYGLTPANIAEAARKLLD
ncbi:MAG: transketolase family protein [Actinobacteria bacterium]|nr:MAG: transketolase family protein [Actinomycetota bacterium]